MTEAALRSADSPRASTSRSVDELDLEVAAGELYALLGPNGAGKTTTLRMAVGLTRPDAGAIRIFGIDALADPLAAKAVTAWLPDEPMLYDKLTPGRISRLRRRPVADPARRGRARGGAAAEMAGAVGRARHALRGLFARHEAEGGAGRRADPRAAPADPRRAADRARRDHGARGQGRAARGGRQGRDRRSSPPISSRSPSGWPTGSGSSATANCSPKARSPSCAHRRDRTTSPSRTPSSG